MREPVNSRCPESTHISHDEQIKLTAELEVLRNSNQKSKVSVFLNIVHDIDSVFVIDVN